MVVHSVEVFNCHVCAKEVVYIIPIEPEEEFRKTYNERKEKAICKTCWTVIYSEEEASE